MRRGRRRLRAGTLTNKPGLFPAFHLFFEKCNNSPGFQMACFNFRRGFINPELFGTSGFSRCGSPKPEGRAGVCRRAAGMLCRLHPEPVGHGAAAPPAQGEVGSVQGWAGGDAGLRQKQGRWCLYRYRSRTGSRGQKMTVCPAAGVGTPRLSSSAVCLLLRG